MRTIESDLEIRQHDEVVTGSPLPSVFNDAAIPSVSVEFDSVTSSVPCSNYCIPPKSSTTTTSSIDPVLAKPPTVCYILRIHKAFSHKI